MSENTAAVGPVYESPEELAAEIVRLREGWDRLAAEIPRLYGRETAADLPHDSEYVTALHDVLVAMKRIERGDATLTSTPKGTLVPSLEERVRELEDLTEAMSAELEAHSRALDGK